MEIFKRLLIVLAIIVTIAALAGIAGGLIFSLGHSHLLPGALISSGFFVAWFFFDAALWERRSVYIWTLLVSLGLVVPGVTASLAGAFISEPKWLDMLLMSTTPLWIWTSLATVTWILFGRSRTDDIEDAATSNPKIRFRAVIRNTFLSLTLLMVLVTFAFAIINPFTETRTQSRIATPTSSPKTTQATIASSQLAYDHAVASLEQKYPQLNPDSPLFDQKAVNKVSDYVDAQTRRGIPADQAVVLAAYYVFEYRASDSDASASPKKTN